VNAWGSGLLRQLQEEAGVGIGVGGGDGCCAGEANGFGGKPEVAAGLV